MCGDVVNSSEKTCLSVALHQYNVTDDKSLNVATGVNQLGRAERAGRTMHGLNRREVEKE